MSGCGERRIGRALSSRVEVVPGSAKLTKLESHVMHTGSESWGLYQRIKSMLYWVYCSPDVNANAIVIAVNNFWWIAHFIACCLCSFLPFPQPSNSGWRQSVFDMNHHHMRTDPNHSDHILSAMIELTISLPFSFRALTAFFRETEACVMTSSMSLASRPLSSTSSSSSSSSSGFLSSTALPLPLSWAWSCPEWSPLDASACANC